MKICLNHFLTPDLTFTPKDDKTWLWSAPDYAEHQITTEQFCIRFKTKEVASEFKAAIDSAKVIHYTLVYTYILIITVNTITC